MSVIYRVVAMRSNPILKNSPIKYYPKAITLGQSVNLKFITERIRDMSSLSRGDIQSVILNFVEKLKEQLLEGKTVNIEGLGVFRLSLQSKGEETEKEVNAKSVRGVRICFMAHKELRISREKTRAGDHLDLISLDEYLKGKTDSSEQESDAPKEANTDAKTEHPDESGVERG